ncbi:hypothetical protein [Rubripirellula obstinata]|nr:hypothetical protein [Rubripirellula obstinata]
MRGDKPDYVAIWIITSTALIFIADAFIYTFGPDLFGRISTSNFGPIWTKCFPVFAITIGCSSLVFCDSRKHAWLMVLSLALIAALSLLNFHFYFSRFWDGFGRI